MTGAMMKGAIADTAMRFPIPAKIAMTLFAPIIDRIVKDTKVNEEYAIELVKK